jgi:integrase
LGEIHSAVQGAGGLLKTATKRKAIADVRKAVASLPDTTRAAKLKFWVLAETIQQYNTKTRKAEIVQMSGIATMSKDEAAKHKAAAAVRLESQMIETKQISRSQIAKLHTMCERWLDSIEYTERAAAIAYFTGRRATEILATAKLKPTATNTALFSGQLKSKGESIAYSIKTLHSAKKIAASLVWLQGVTSRKFSGLSLEQIEHKTNRPLAETIYTLFDTIGWDGPRKDFNRGKVAGERKTESVPAVHFHDLRKLYILSVLGGKTDRLTVQKLLGHESIDTGKHYENWVFTD